MASSTRYRRGSRSSVDRFSPRFYKRRHCAIIYMAHDDNYHDDDNGVHDDVVIDHSEQSELVLNG